MFCRKLCFLLHQDLWKGITYYFIGTHSPLPHLWLIPGHYLLGKRFQGVRTTKSYDVRMLPNQRGELSLQLPHGYILLYDFCLSFELPGSLVLTGK